MSANRILLAAAALTLLFVGGCKRNGSERNAPSGTAVASTATESFAFKVRTVPVQPGQLTVTREASGRIEPDRDVRVASKVGEKVVAVPVREGDRVEKGQLLVQLDDRSYRDQLRRAELSLEQARLSLSSTEKRLQDQGAQLLAQLEAARQNLANARKRLEEGRALLNLGGIAPVEVDALEAAVSQAASNAAGAEAAYRRWQRSKDEDLAQLRLQVRQARVGLDQARQALADTRILAPFAGEVAARFVEAGAFVGPGAPVVQLVSGPRNVIFRLPPDEIAHLESGALELIYLGSTYPLRLERTSPVPGQDRLVRVYARPVEEGPELPFGGAVLVRYQVVLAEGPLAPANAIRVREGQTFVYAVQDGRARAVAVEVVAEADGRAVLQGEAVPERIVFPLPQDLRDGSDVEVLE